LKTVRGKPCAIVSFLSGLSVRRPTAAHSGRPRGPGAATSAARVSLWRAPTTSASRPGRAVRGALQRGRRLKPGLAKTISSDLELLGARWPRALPEGIVHADYFPDNVFFAGAKFAGAIDFYFACVMRWPMTSPWR